MPYSGTTYSELATAADYVEDQIGAHAIRLRDAKGEFSSIASSLQALANEYGPIVDHSAALLAAQPTDTAVLWLRAHILQLLGDFTVLQAEAAARDAQVNGNQ